MNGESHKMGGGIPLQVIEEALKEGAFDKVYKETGNIRGVIASSQARRILEEVRKIKETKNKKEMKNLIVKTLLTLEYQYKRGVIKNEVADEYKKILSSALKLTDGDTDIEQLGKNLYYLIEMLTIKFYKRERGES